MAVIADVFEVVLIDTDDNVVGTTTLQDASIEVSVEENDVRGGRNNALLGILHSDRDINIELNDINFRYDWLAKQFGQDIKTGAGVAYHMPTFKDVVDDKITLDEEPIEGTIVIIDEDGEKLEPVIVTGKEVELPVGSGPTVEVRTYQYETPATTEKFEIDNTKFAKGVRAILETLEVDEAEERATHRVQYEFPNALPTGNVSIETASAREAQAQSMSLRVIKPRTSNIVGTVKRIPLQA